MQSGSTPGIKNEYDRIGVPSIADQELKLQQLVQQGVMTPEQAATISQNPSAMDQISSDPSLKQNQMDALLGLQNISDSGGMTIADKANLNDIKNQEDTAARGKQEAILQNAQARGMGGSGLELMKSLQNQQDSATRNSQRDLDVAGQAQQRALQALMQQGQLAGQIQGQDFNQQAQKAQSEDAISRFNAQNQQNQINQNVAARNQAQNQNLGAKQAVANTNVDLANNQQQYNKQLAQTNFQNQMAKAGGQTAVNSQNASNQGRDSQNAADAYNKGFDKWTSAAGMMAMSDEREKKDVKEFSPSDFLDSITAHKFKYKNPAKHGKGEHVGVMAQDLEKTPAGSKMVTDTPDGKMVDYSKSGPAVMASLANIHKRLSGLEMKKKGL